jgi:2'-5' RNA ligase
MPHPVKHSWAQNADWQRPLYRLIAMLFPDRYACEEFGLQARSCCATEGLTGRPFALNRFHLSLCLFWENRFVPEKVIRVAQMMCARIADGTSSFEVELDQLKTFSVNKERKPLVMCSERRNRALLQLFRDFHGGLEGIAEDLNIEPHVTLLYDEKRVGERIVAPISWMAKEIVLVISHVGQTRYDECGRWLLES